MIDYHRSATHVATLRIAAHAVNPLDGQFRHALDAALGRLETDAQLAGVVLALNGADDAGAAPAAGHALEHLIALTTAQAGDCMAALAAWHALLRRLETLGKPVVATLAGAVHGDALGLALACHRRLALAGASLRMPQAAMGLTPCGGALVRTVRSVGLKAALPLLVDGAALDVAAALQAGLLQGQADSAGELAALAGAVLAASAAPAQPWDEQHYRMPGGAVGAAQLQVLLQTAPALLRARTGGHYPAPEATLCAMVEGAQVDFASALLIEGRYFCHVAAGAVAKNLLRLSRQRLAAPARDEAFCAALQQACRGELQRLAQEGLPPALIGNAARAAGMPADPPPPQQALAATPAPAPAAAVGADDARDRLLYAQCVAALAALAARGGDAPTAAQADLISVDLCGFPAHTGGAVAFVNHVGAAAFAARAAALAERYGQRFAPPAVQ